MSVNSDQVNQIFYYIQEIPIKIKSISARTLQIPTVLSTVTQTALKRTAEVAMEQAPVWGKKQEDQQTNEIHQEEKITEKKV